MITRVEVRRRELSLSQKDLARKIGFDQSLLSRFERGFSARVSRNFRRRVAEALGMSQRELFGKESHET